MEALFFFVEAQHTPRVLRCFIAFLWKPSIELWTEFLHLERPDARQKTIERTHFGALIKTVISKFFSGGRHRTVEPQTVISQIILDT